MTIQCHIHEITQKNRLDNLLQVRLVRLLLTWFKLRGTEQTSGSGVDGSFGPNDFILACKNPLARIICLWLLKFVCKKRCEKSVLNVVARLDESKACDATPRLEFDIEDKSLKQFDESMNESVIVNEDTNNTAKAMMMIAVIFL